MFVCKHFDRIKGRLSKQAETCQKSRVLILKRPTILTKTKTCAGENVYKRKIFIGWDVNLGLDRRKIFIG